MNKLKGIYEKFIRKCLFDCLDIKWQRCHLTYFNKEDDFCNKQESSSFDLLHNILGKILCKATLQIEQFRKILKLQYA